MISSLDADTRKEISKRRRIKLWDVLYGTGGSGHWGGSSSWIELSTELWTTKDRGFLIFDPDKPEWEERDRFIASEGHVYPTQCVALNDIGLIDDDKLDTLRRVDFNSALGSSDYLQGHPSRNLNYGIEATSGSLGVGLSVATGIAAGLKKKGMRNRIVVLLGDGEIQEGIVSETLRNIGYQGLNNMILVLNNNGLQNDTYTKFRSFDPPPITTQLEEYGFHVVGKPERYEDRIAHDGHDPYYIHDSLHEAADSEKPALVVLNTLKGYGIDFTANSRDWHGRGPDESNYRSGLEQLNK